MAWINYFIDLLQTRSYAGLGGQYELEKLYYHLS